VSTTLTWPEITLRLALAALAGGLIGLNRGEHDRRAGLRTNLLVCLAAALSMIQMNLLLPATGKTNASFAVMDVMRLPLGILSGMGFIGAGAILRRGEFVLRVTTAATLWFVTILGLCFGGGQIALGLAGVALGLAVLWGLKPIEGRWKQDCHARFTVVFEEEALDEQELSRRLAADGYQASAWALTDCKRPSPRRKLCCDVRWRCHPTRMYSPGWLKELSEDSRVSKVDWKP
jgi:putative Mg2+ transporter-C (MgtC) family protein